MRLFEVHKRRVISDLKFKCMKHARERLPLRACPTAHYKEKLRWFVVRRRELVALPRTLWPRREQE